MTSSSEVEPMRRLWDLEGDFIGLEGLPMENQFKKHRRRLRQGLMYRSESELRALREAEAERVEKRKQILKNFQIVLQSTGKRQEYALYRLWRYLDVEKSVIAGFMRLNVPKSPYGSETSLTALFADIFAEQCAKAERCVLRPFVPKADPSHICMLEGCGKPVGYYQSEHRWKKFCTKKHYLEYSKLHPEIYFPKKSILEKAAILEKVLSEISSGKVEYQSQLNGRYGSLQSSRYCVELEREKKLTRESTKYDGRWTFKLTLPKEASE